VLNFTSALYLGFEHSSDTLRPWKSLTTGVPAVLGALPGAAALAGDLAAITGSESATLAPSTLHVFWDLFGIWPKERISIHVDERAYPVGRWGVERMAAQGVPAGTFAHHDPGSLAGKLRNGRRPARRPVVLTDGYCPECGRMAPLPEYLTLLRRFGGWLVVDDTQAFGIFGARPCPAAPHGKGGGGSLQWWATPAAEALVVCSMAKAFGAPLAFVAGSRRMIRRFEMNSETRVHSSPVSAAQISAGERAVVLNRDRGDEVRRILSQRVKRFRSQLAKAGWEPAGGQFPVQSFPIPSEKEAMSMYAGLLRSGIETVLQAAGHDGQRRIAFLITANHSAGDLDQAAEAWLRIVGAGTPARLGKEV
jgi:8-amino-7-oxononanoate synthase